MPFHPPNGEPQMPRPSTPVAAGTPILGGGPIRAAVALTLAWLVVATALFLVIRAVAPGLDSFERAILPIAVVAVLVVALVARLGWWREIGINAPSDWRATGLLILPAVIVVAPLAGGVTVPDGGTLLLLVVGYVLTGVAEESFSRGVILRVLAPLGAVRSVVLMAALFGVMHLGNVVNRDSMAIVLAQSVGAFAFAVGYGALRLRTNTIVPLMALHFGHDLVLQLTNLPLIPVDVAQDVILLGYGIWILRAIRREARVRPAPDGVAGARVEAEPAR
jgi:membrane protease YdiL (CAAX protease family)